MLFAKLRERFKTYEKKFENMSDRQQNVRYAALASVGAIVYALLCVMWNGFLIAIPVGIVFGLAYMFISFLRD